MHTALREGLANVAELFSTRRKRQELTLPLLKCKLKEEKKKVEKEEKIFGFEDIPKKSTPPTPSLLARIFERPGMGFE